MARMDGIEPDQAEGRVADAFKEQEKMWGAPLLPYRIYARRPSIFHAVRGMWGGVAASGLIDGKLGALYHARMTGTADTAPRIDEQLPTGDLRTAKGDVVPILALRSPFPGLSIQGTQFAFARLLFAFRKIFAVIAPAVNRALVLRHMDDAGNHLEVALHGDVIG